MTDSRRARVRTLPFAWSGRLIATAALALTLAALSAAPAGAADDGWAKLAVPAQVRGGERIVLRNGAPPAEVDEFEVLLSLDDGRTFPLRVTRELAAGSRAIEWRVPHFASASARLRVRYRFGGLEVNGPLSAPFMILARGEAQDLHVFHECGWWEGLDDPAPGPASRWAPGAVPMLSAAEPPSAIAPETGGLEFEPVTSHPFDAPPREDSPRLLPTPVPQTSARFRPLRN